MRATQEWLDTALQKNPSLRMTVQAGKAGIEAEKQKKSPKYRNTKVYVYSSGIAVETKDPRLGTIMETYDSRKEYRRHTELELLQKAGKISDLKRQQPIVVQDGCEVHGEKIRPIIYRADFTYSRQGRLIVEDVKGQDPHTGKHITTQDFLLKWKLLKAKYPQRYFEIY